MRATRPVVVAVVVLLVAAACGSGLTDAERVWCRDHQDDVIGAVSEFYFGTAVWESQLEYQTASTGGYGYLYKWLGDLPEMYPAEYRRSCQAAFEGR